MKSIPNEFFMEKKAIFPQKLTVSEWIDFFTRPKSTIEKRNILREFVQNQKIIAVEYKYLNQGTIKDEIFQVLDFIINELEHDAEAIALLFRTCNHHPLLLNMPVDEEYMEFNYLIFFDALSKIKRVQRTNPQ